MLLLSAHLCMTDRTFTFDPFALDSSRNELRRSGEPFNLIQ